MTTIKKGKGETKPMKGQKVGCYYKGHLDNQDGKIFDQLQPKVGFPRAEGASSKLTLW